MGDKDINLIEAILHLANGPKVSVFGPDLSYVLITSGFVLVDAISLDV